LPRSFFIAESKQRKGGQTLLFSRISYGAQELAVFLLENSPPILSDLPLREKESVLFSPILERRERDKGGEPEPMNIFDDAEVIATYPLQQAIKDGVLVEIFKSRWDELSHGKPIVATAHLAQDISLAGLMEIWHAFIYWRKHIMLSLPEKNQLFQMIMNGKTVWVMEDDAAFTLMYPEDY
jgi:hypothetical protein